MNSIQYFVIVSTQVDVLAKVTAKIFQERVKRQKIIFDMLYKVEYTKNTVISR